MLLYYTKMTEVLAAITIYKVMVCIIIDHYFSNSFRACPVLPLVSFVEFFLAFSSKLVRFKHC
ncbi:hypothetical protein HanXRQr2_Chr10g0443431 [Helianthus annuus]|uniref:Uncharacterized protein n=1 Tax=Helianthus annuus TaxID=4232 RepID=A0A9K3HY38_HELAN|nr:hypothetical protein HanXRQr2_Chr10g0443431 [Helianthus annuus]